MKKQEKINKKRTLKACDECRKMKIKCILKLNDNPPCQACLQSGRICKFEHVGVKREKPPSIHQIESLNLKIAQLEAKLIELRPEIDLSSLPRNNDHARAIANSKKDKLVNHIQSINHLQYKSNISNEEDEINQETIKSRNNTNYQKDQDKNDQNLELMMQALDQCEISTSDLLDQNQSCKKSHSQENLTSNHNHQGQSLSITQEYCMQKLLLQTYSNESWPDPDLANKLIDIYFNHIHSYPLILHQKEFKSQFQSGLAKRDHQFAQLCFAIFAAASPYSDDPRVLYPHQQELSHPYQSAGSLFALAALSRPFFTPNTLLQLQTMAILSLYLLKMSNPRNISAIVQTFLRKGQSIS